MNIDESRLSMQHFIVAKKVKELQKSKKSKPRILIPLTPGTSFNLQTSAGNMNERALMFAILSHLDDFKDHKTALKNRLNIYGAMEIIGQILSTNMKKISKKMYALDTEKTSAKRW